MHIATKLLKSQLRLLRPILARDALEPSRTAQDRTGALIKRRFMRFEHIQFEEFEATYAMPNGAAAGAAILYLHGGGYTAGTLKYAEGFGSILADKTSVDTLCAAYRLAPENPFPAALEDAVTAYRCLLERGIAANKIILAGESAGGGLCYALCLWLRDHGVDLPAGVIAISPWTDLFLSGAPLVDNPDKDPMLSVEQIQFFVDCYAGGQDTRNPYISPVFGNLAGLPDTILFAGGDEMLLDDARRMHEALAASGVNARLYVQPEMWHSYILYGVDESKEDYERIAAFVSAHIQ